MAAGRSEAFAEVGESAVTPPLPFHHPSSAFRGLVQGDMRAQRGAEAPIHLRLLYNLGSKRR